MEQTPTIYTYGQNVINVTELMALLQPYGINCVVDCRLTTSLPHGNTPVQELAETLKQSNIFYLPFYQHFGYFSPEVCNKRGAFIYKKAIQTEKFLEGIERIKNGLNKGYTILIIDSQKDLKKSKRYNLIGKYLNDSSTIIHLTENKSCITQNEVEHCLDKYVEKRKENKIKAAEIGRAGEELAGLYLMQNNYQILDRNWNLYKGCELDIVALKDNKLYFIEVKTRSSDKYGEPQLAITKQKMRHITKAIHEYRFRRALFNMEYQIDSIAIIYRSEQDYDLHHFPDIRPDYYTAKYNLPYRNH